MDTITFSEMNILDKLLDATKLRELRALSDGSDQLSILLLQKFSETTNLALEKLEMHLNEKDYSGAGATLHSIKGAAGNLGLIQLHKICLAAEEELDAADHAAFLEKCQNVILIWREIESQLRPIL